MTREQSRLQDGAAVWEGVSRGNTGEEVVGPVLSQSAATNEARIRLGGSGAQRFQLRFGKLNEVRYDCIPDPDWQGIAVDFFETRECGLLGCHIPF